MNKFKEVLDDFSDYEIAVFFKYKLKEYTASTQTKIIDYIKTSRKLDESKIEKLVVEKPAIKEFDDSIYCPRCSSKKLLKMRVKWTPPVFRVGYEDEMATWKELTTGEATYKDKVECFVCGYKLYDPNNEKRTFREKILDVLFDTPLNI